MRILVTGSRTLDGADAYRALDEILREIEAIERRWIGCVIHGGAAGVDALADRWARQKGVARWVFPADWQRWGKRAGPLRNAEMIRRGKPHAVAAIWDGTSRGTDHMMRIADRKGIPVYVRLL